MGLYRNFTISFSIVTLMCDSFLTMYKWTEIKLRKQSSMEELLMLIIEDYCQFIHENRSTRRFEEALLFTVDGGREIMPAHGTDQIKKFVTVPS